MRQEKTEHDSKANQTVLIEGLEARRMMSGGAVTGPSASAGTIADRMHCGVITMAFRPNSKGAPADVASAAPIIERESGAAKDVFSAALIPRPGTDNILVAAMGEVNGAPSVAVVGSNAANQGARALGVSSAHSFAGRPPRREQGRSVSNSRGRVLLIEDDANTRRALSAILQSQGWHVSTAATVADGIRLLATRPDHVTVDLMPPDGDGAQILEHANASDLHPHMTVATGVADSDHLDRVRQLGAEAVFIKPVNLPDLLKQLSN